MNRQKKCRSVETFSSIALLALSTFCLCPAVFAADYDVGTDEYSSLAAAKTSQVNSAPLSETAGSLIQFEIPAQRFSDALLEFSRQSGIAVLMSSSIEGQWQSQPLRGELPPYQALTQLLDGTDLIYRSVADQSLVIVPRPVNPIRRRQHSAQQPPSVLEEITVTAGKRISNLQDTPMTVTALDYQTLQDLRVTSVFDVIDQVPSLKLVRNGDHTASMLYLRGVGADNPTEAGDSGVATHVDGIYSSRSQGTAVLLHDLEQIEILRGPQGSLFGRNATSGVVNYHTVKPQEHFESRLDLTVAEANYHSLQGVVNLPVTDQWSVRLAAATEQRDGLIKFASGSASSNDNKQYNNLDVSSYRLSSLWKPNDEWRWWASYEYYRNQSSGNLPAVDYDTPVLIDTVGETDLVMHSLRSRLQWQFTPDLDVTYIFGHSDMTRDQLWDGDGNSPVGSETNPAIYHQSNHTVWSDYQSWQHELQLKNSDDNRLRWLLSYFYFEEESDIRFDLEHQDATGLGWGGGASHSYQQPHRGSKFEAIYGQLHYDLTTEWGVSLGARSGSDLRYDKDGRNYGCPDLIRSDRQGDLGVVAVNRDSAAANQCFVANYNDVDKRWNSTTFMARAEWRGTPDLLLYLMVAEGFKPGIVQDGGMVSGVFSGADDPAFESQLDQVLAANKTDEGAYVGPEESRNWELGVKWQAKDKTLTINGALFYTDYDNLQVSRVSLNSDGSEVFRSASAATATIKGMEVELNWLPGRFGELKAHFSLLNAYYDDFLSVDALFPEYGETWNPSAGDPNQPALVDFSGNRMKQAPKFSAGLTYKHYFSPFQWGRITASVGVKYSDEVYLSEANRKDRSGQLLDNSSGQWVADINGAASNIDVQPAYWVWNTNLVIKPHAADWRLEAFVHNLTDEVVRYDVHAPEAPDPLFYLAPPRTVGMRLSMDFR
ncbi:MAG: TonB-dependent receptor domain-containing protein [Cellvibrionaceae bacterium]